MGRSVMEIEEKVEAPTGEQVQGDQQAAPESKAPAATEPDYKAELGKMETALAAEREEKARLKSRLDGLEGTVFHRQALERASKVSDGKIEELKETIKAFILSQTPDDPNHPARKAISDYEARSQEERSQAALKATIDQDWNAIVEAVAEAEGKKLESNEDAQEIEAFMKGDPTWRNIYNSVAQGNAQGNPDIVRGALFKTWRLTKDVTAKHHKAELAEVQKKADKTAEDRFNDMLKQKGLLEMPNPRAAGVSGKGRKPTAQEIHDASVEEYTAKKKSGEWIL